MSLKGEEKVLLAGGLSLSHCVLNVFVFVLLTDLSEDLYSVSLPTGQIITNLAASGHARLLSHSPVGHKSGWARFSAQGLIRLKLRYWRDWPLIWRPWGRIRFQTPSLLAIFKSLQL